MRPLFALMMLFAVLVPPLASASAYYHGSYVVPDQAAYLTGMDGCSWSQAGVYVTQGPPFGDNCVHLAVGSVGRAWTMSFNGSVLAPTAWRVCFWSNASLGCATGSGTIPPNAAFFSFTARDGVAVKWNMTVV